MEKQRIEKENHLTLWEERLKQWEQRLEQWEQRLKGEEAALQKPMWSVSSSSRNAEAVVHPKIFENACEKGSFLFN